MLTLTWHLYFAQPSTVKIIPRQLFEVPIQAAVGNTIIARRTLSALRADVTAGLYGGQCFLRPTAPSTTHVVGTVVPVDSVTDSCVRLQVTTSAS